MAYPAAEEPEVVFDHPDGTYRRGGYCSRCGQCCRGDPGEEMAELPAREFDGEVYCPLFDIRDGLGCCTNRRHPYYKRGCASFPEHPSQIADKPGCTYTFERVS